MALTKIIGAGISGATIDSSERILTTSRPAFKAFKTGGAWQSFGGTSVTLFPFDSTQTNVGTCYDTTNYKFVAPIAGLYYLDLNWYTDGSINEAYLYLNSESDPRSYGRSNDQGSNCFCSLLIELSANDEIKAYGSVTASNADDWYAREDRSFFQGYLVG